MTIVTTEIPQLGFGKGRLGWIVDTGVKIATELLDGIDYSKYAQLPPLGDVILQKKPKKKQFSSYNQSYSKLQTNRGRRARIKGRRYKYQSYVCRCGRQLRGTNRFKRASTNRSYHKFYRNNGKLYESRFN